jgi:hypothetical protein
MAPYVQAWQRHRPATGKRAKEPIVWRSDPGHPGAATRHHQRGRPEGVELEGTEPFLRGGGLTFVGADGTSRFCIDLSRTRLADPLTVVGSALLALRAAEEGRTPRLVLPRDAAELRNLTLLGLFDCLDPAWCPASPSSPELSLPDRCLRLRRLDFRGGRRAEDFVGCCTELLDKQAGSPRLPRPVGQVLVEVIENALAHARSPVGVYAAARLYRSGRVVGGPGLEVAVGDAGVGMLGTLRDRYRWIARSVDALREAFKPRVSGRPPGERLHRGEGLPLVRDRIHRRIPHAELIIVSGNAFACLRAGESRDVYGMRPALSSGNDLTEAHFDGWGTWARLRIPIGG